MDSSPVRGGAPSFDIASTQKSIHICQQMIASLSLEVTNLKSQLISQQNSPSVNALPPHTQYANGSYRFSDPLDEYLCNYAESNPDLGVQIKKKSRNVYSVNGVLVSLQLDNQTCFACVDKKLVEWDQFLYLLATDALSNSDLLSPPQHQEIDDTSSEKQNQSSCCGPSTTTKSVQRPASIRQTTSTRPVSPHHHHATSSPTATYYQPTVPMPLNNAHPSFVPFPPYPQAGAPFFNPYSFNPYLFPFNSSEPPKKSVSAKGKSVKGKSVKNPKAKPKSKSVKRNK